MISMGCILIYWDYSGIIVGFNGILMECNGNRIISFIHGILLGLNWIYGTNNDMMNMGIAWF